MVGGMGAGWAHLPGRTHTSPGEQALVESGGKVGDRVTVPIGKCTLLPLVGPGTEPLQAARDGGMAACLSAVWGPCGRWFGLGVLGFVSYGVHYIVKFPCFCQF